MAKKTYSKDDALKAWEQDDQRGVLEIVEVEVGKEGDSRKQTQILNRKNGSLVVAVDGSGADAYRQLAENPRDPFIDRGESPTEQIEGDEPRFTSDGVLATPTQPASLEGTRDVVEVDNSKPRQTVKR